MLRRETGRISEIDALRGVAIILMVIFHIIVDLTDFFGYNIAYLSGFWYYVGKTSAILFMFLAGISATFNKSVFRHGLKLLVWGLILTVATWLFTPALYIRFGILHFLGTCLLSWPLLKKAQLGTLIFLAVCTISLGPYVASQTFSGWWLLPLGLMPPDFASMDYYPLFPWYGVFLTGALTGKMLYQSKTSLVPALNPPKTLIWLGRRSLVIYLVHQPVILAILYALH